VNLSPSGQYINDGLSSTLFRDTVTMEWTCPCGNTTSLTTSLGKWL